MKNLLKRLKSTRGEGYVDITVAVLIIMILLAGVIKISPVFITKKTLNSFVFNTAPITISATAEGTSEVFWK